MTPTSGSSHPRTFQLLPQVTLSFKVQFVIGAVLLFLAFIGVMLTNWQNAYTHVYWLALIGVYALTSLMMSAYASRAKQGLSWSLIGRELLHWLGLFMMVYLVEHFKHMGLYSTPIASLVELQLLALTTFLAGVHFNAVFLLIGIFLAIIAYLSVMVFEYLSVIVLPIFIVFVVILGWQVYVRRGVK